MKARRVAVWLLLVATLGFASQAVAETQTLQGLFDEGNAAFYRADYDVAIARYDTLVDSGVRDADVYFNLAAAHGRRGELGYAMLYLERAARRRPGDAEIETQLSQVRDALTLRAAARDGEATVRTRPPVREALVASFSENGLAIALLCLELLALGLLAARLRTGQENTRLALNVGTALAGVATVLCAFGLYVKSGVGREGEPAVVLHAVPLREGPDDQAQSRGEAAEGALSTVLLREGKWVQVHIQDGPRGWLPEDQVGVLKLD